ncbi:hypothetical protein P4O66_002577 [Electrophorus voltai]|uniref:Uncharacterized protein n=1 Tax=Electrophorus voltai TaxID=2609070 RepID=A0AAD8YXU4_9TELE|nr:hypothetical protein P4O66_002577 [Electrophorus voltai]
MAKVATVALHVQLVFIINADCGPGNAGAVSIVAAAFTVFTVLADPDLDAAPPRAPQLIQQPQALANPPPYPQPGTSLTPKPSPYDELRRQLEAITSPVAHRTRSYTTIKPSAEPEVGYAPQFPMVEVSGPEGVIMVHRHWTADDIMKAADGLSKPGDIGGRRFGQELMAFVQSCRPTQAELRWLLMMRKRKRREN